MQIKITVEGTVITADLYDNPTSRDLYSLLPAELYMNPLQNREFYGNIQLFSDTKRQDGYQIGDIGYWIPGETLVLYYGPGYTDNLIIMGHITEGLEKLATNDHGFTAVIEKASF